MVNRRYDPRKHNRRSIRRRGWDYRWPGAYFVTICTHERAYLFENGAFRDVAANAWRAIPGHEHAQHVQLDEWVVMPNHVHGIIVIDRELDVGARQAGTNVEEQDQSAMRPASPSTGDAREDDGVGRRNRARQVGRKVARGDEGGGRQNRARQVGRKVTRGDGDGSRPASPLREQSREGPNGVERGSIGAIVGNYKSLVARRINHLRRTPGGKVWQRGYYDRIVRNERELKAIRRYIRENPRRWAEDRENLERLTARMRRVT